MFDVDEELQLAMLIRDSQQIDVIVSLDRLAVLPENKEQLELSKKDLERLKSFFETRVSGVSESLNSMASEIFVEHVNLIKEKFTR